MRLPTGLDSYPCTPASVRLTTNDIYTFDVDLAVVHYMCTHGEFIWNGDWGFKASVL